MSVFTASLCLSLLYGAAGTLRGTAPSAFFFSFWPTQTKQGPRRDAAVSSLMGKKGDDELLDPFGGFRIGGELKGFDPFDQEQIMKQVKKKKPKPVGGRFSNWDGTASLEYTGRKDPDPEWLASNPAFPTLKGDELENRRKQLREMQKDEDFDPEDFMASVQGMDEESMLDGLPAPTRGGRPGQVRGRQPPRRGAMPPAPPPWAREGAPTARSEGGGKTPGRAQNLDWMSMGNGLKLDFGGETGDVEGVYTGASPTPTPPVAKGVGLGGGAVAPPTSSASFASPSRGPTTGPITPDDQKRELMKRMGLADLEPDVQRPMIVAGMGDESDILEMEKKIFGATDALSSKEEEESFTTEEEKRLRVSIMYEEQTGRKYDFGSEDPVYVPAASSEQPAFEADEDFEALTDSDVLGNIETAEADWEALGENERDSQLKEAEEKMGMDGDLPLSSLSISPEDGPSQDFTRLSQAVPLTSHKTPSPPAAETPHHSSPTSTHQSSSSSDVVVGNRKMPSGVADLFEEEGEIETERRRRGQYSPTPTVFSPPPAISQAAQDTEDEEIERDLQRRQEMQQWGGRSEEAESVAEKLRMQNAAAMPGDQSAAAAFLEKKRREREEAYEADKANIKFNEPDVWGDDARAEAAAEAAAESRATAGLTAEQKISYIQEKKKQRRQELMEEMEELDRFAGVTQEELEEMRVKRMQELRNRGSRNQRQADRLAVEADDWLDDNVAGPTWLKRILGSSEGAEGEQEGGGQGESSDVASVEAPGNPADIPARLRKVRRTEQKNPWTSVVAQERNTFVAMAAKRKAEDEAERRRLRKAQLKNALIIAGDCPVAPFLRDLLERAGMEVNMLTGREPVAYQQQRTASGKMTAQGKLQSADVVFIVPDTNKAVDTEGGFLGGLFGGGSSSDLKITKDNLQMWLKKLGRVRHVVLMSPLGLDRSGSKGMKGIFGDLNERRNLEDAVVYRSKQAGFDFTLVRVGKLVPPSEGQRGMAMEPGDRMSLESVTTHDTAAECLYRLLEQRGSYNSTLSVVSTKFQQPKEWEWDDGFVKLDGPELTRVSVHGADPGRLLAFVRDWAQLWLPGGDYFGTLTTPVTLKTLPGGVRLQFNSKRQRIEDPEDYDELGPQQWSQPQPSPSKEGGVDVVVEDWPVSRVRAIRSCMGDGAVVKESSEARIVGALRDDMRRYKRLHERRK
uniref:NAD(P)-binding domain-containing protein n=1 Tax=Chromera velia CCMP2878 TaxID=1169474 RepID=A0A0G4ICR7_9ALVE|eukprot:Cvel_13189.t1-p1 / transcript=Cvel_13189.t1 / gene=Cvel_13189 / organism=Chromera_velia_CCMP2878 / gene_product=hypothetical protein / transcript_product=hypothetical protein / location=Cvel_scaffold891:50215-58241(+) / protein_length=1191 / sequence_SO=supercontig / SO=protein_coding / is_pseudo=false